MNCVITLVFQVRPVRFNSDGWIDAALAAKHFGKKPAAWLRSIEMLEYLSALAETLFGKGVSESHLKQLRSRDSRSKAAKALTLKSYTVLKYPSDKPHGKFGPQEQIPSY